MQAWIRLRDDRLLADDLGVILRVGGARGGVPQLGEVAVAADVLDELLLLEVVGERDGIDGHAVVDVELGGGLVDLLVGEDVEVVGLEELHHVGDDALSRSMLPSTLLSASRLCGRRLGPCDRGSLSHGRLRVVHSRTGHQETRLGSVPLFVFPGCPSLTRKQTSVTSLTEEPAARHMLYLRLPLSAEPTPSRLTRHCFCGTTMTLTLVSMS